MPRSGGEGSCDDFEWEGGNSRGTEGEMEWG